MERIVGTPETQPRRRSNRVRLWILVPVALVVVAAGTYAWVQEVRQPLEVACYAQPSLGANRAIVPAVQGNPQAACLALWRSGGSFNPTNQAPPALTACVLPSGTIGVFPPASTGDPCAALGLAHPAAGSAGTTSVERMSEDLIAAFTSACVSRDDAIKIAREALVVEGLALDWRVVASVPFSAQSPCASAYVDVPGHTVRILPSSKPALP